MNRANTVWRREDYLSQGREAHKVRNMSRIHQETSTASGGIFIIWMVNPFRVCRLQLAHHNVLDIMSRAPHAITKQRTGIRRVHKAL